MLSASRSIDMYASLAAREHEAARMRIAHQSGWSNTKIWIKLEAKNYDCHCIFRQLTFYLTSITLAVKDSPKLAWWIFHVWSAASKWLPLFVILLTPTYVYWTLVETSYTGTWVRGAGCTRHGHVSTGVRGHMERCCTWVYVYTNRMEDGGKPEDRVLGFSWVNGPKNGRGIHVNKSMIQSHGYLFTPSHGCLSNSDAWGEEYR